MIVSIPGTLVSSVNDSPVDDALAEVHVSSWGAVGPLRGLVFNSGQQIGNRLDPVPVSLSRSRPVPQSRSVARLPRISVWVNPLAPPPPLILPKTCSVTS